MRVSRISGRGLVAIVATVLVLQGTSNAIAQFAPLALPGVNSQKPAYTQNQAYGQQNQVPSQSRYQAYAPHQAYAPNQAYTPKQVYPQNQAYTQNLNQIYSQNPGFPQTKPQMQPQYTAMAFQANGGQAVAPMGDAAAPVPMPASGYAAQADPCQSAPAASYRSYDNGGCAGDGSGYNTFANSSGYGGAGSGLGLGPQRGCGRRWFGGFYGLNVLVATGCHWASPRPPLV